MSCYFIGDPHLGHKNIHTFRKFLKNEEHNTKLITEQWKKTIRNRDQVFVMGDAAFTEEALISLGNLPGRKILVKGNHDDMVSTALQSQVFEEIHGIIKYKRMWLSHAPIHPAELRGKPNVHGHVHEATIKRFGLIDKRYFNTCIDVIYPRTKSVFVKLETIKQYYNIK
jgi:calcineurin-like phosphoesterase family protein